MNDFFSTLTIIVEFPVWFPLAVGLSGVLFGTGIVLGSLWWVDWLSYRAIQRERRTAVVPARGIKTETKGASAPAAALAVRSEPEPEPVVPVISPRNTPVLSGEQAGDLLNRAKLGGGYLLRDTSSLLRVAPETVLKLVRDGRLVSYADENRRTWIRARSVVALLDGVPPQPTVSVPAGIGGETDEDDDVDAGSADVGREGNEGARGDDGEGEDESAWGDEESETGFGVPSVAVPVEGKQSLARKPSPLIRQHYWYHIRGGKARYTTLAEVLSAVGYAGDTREWSRLPESVRTRIRREKFEG